MVRTFAIAAGLASSLSFAAETTPPPSPTVQAQSTPAPSAQSGSGNQWTREDQVTWPKTGIGIGIGPVSGLSLYHTNAASSFMQGLIAFENDGDFFASGDLCSIVDKLIPRVPRLDPYFGFGVVVLRYSHVWDRWGFNEFNDDATHKLMIGGRIPIGVNYAIPQTPLMATVEIAPGLLLAPGTYVTLQALAALRVLF